MREWLGIDGEGIGREPHCYTLLAVSDAKGGHAHIESAGLGTAECLAFLLQIPPTYRVAGYYLGYDWTMILADLPDADLYSLFRPETRALPAADGGGFSRIHWRGYSLHYLSGAMRVKRGRRAVTVWDLGKFFQSPFVTALRRWEIDAPIDDIARMKGERSGFSAEQRVEIREYCFAECQALARLAASLESAHVEAGVRPASWHGPGSTAGALLKRWGVDRRLGDIPGAVQHAAWCAYFGGRFENAASGTFDDCHGHDIASAYPYHAYGLPCLEHGHWTHTTRESDLPEAPGLHSHAVVRYDVVDIGPNARWGPLPCRLPNGGIVFPRGGFSGWCWLAEYRSAVAHTSGVRLREAWVLKSECECHVFGGLLDLYRERVRIGKNGKGIVIKLAVNSVPGKLSQRHEGRYSSRVWAGMVTSGTRAQLFDLASTAPETVIAMATDGIYGRERLPFPPAPLAPDTLGSWEYKREGRMTHVRPGIYWSHDTDTLRARGLGRRQLEAQRALCLDAMAEGLDRADLGHRTVFGGAKQCVYRAGPETRRSRHYGQWHDIPARVSLGSAPKRDDDYRLWTLPGIESAAYSTGITHFDLAFGNRE